jgi:hypothetical protein
VGAAGPEHLQKRFRRPHDAHPAFARGLAKSSSPDDGYKFEGMRGILAGRDFDGGFKIKNVGRTASR